MGIDTTEQRDAESTEAKAPKLRRGAAPTPTIDAAPPARRNIVSDAITSFRAGIGELNWGIVLLFGLLAGVLMPISLAQAGALSFLAGIVPVGAGLFIGRRAKGHYGLHGFMTGLIGAAIALVVLGVLLFFTPLGETARATVTGQTTTGIPVTLTDVWIQLGGFIAFSLVTFTTFGATMSGRTEDRNKQLRTQMESRGGRLERPGAVRTVEDIQGMSLPQFGGYVNALFKKQGFTFKDYQFIDKDRHLDLFYQYEGEPWHLRLSVADKVSNGTIEGLNQELRRTGVRKGMVVTSTEFLPSAIKSAKNHRSIVLVDGPTLYQMAEAK